VNFPAAKVLGLIPTDVEVKTMIGRHDMVVARPNFEGAIGKNGRAGLILRVGANPSKLNCIADRVSRFEELAPQRGSPCSNP
jgi:hypothetical protein